MTAYDLPLVAGDTLRVVPSIVVPPPVIVPQPVIRAWGPADGNPRLAALIADLSVDEIRVQAGTYLRPSINQWVSRKVHPLRIVPEAGAVIVWDGQGSGFGPIHLGAKVGQPNVPLFVTDYITIDGRNQITVVKYKLDQDGAAYLGWCNQVWVHRLIVKIQGFQIGSSMSHALYLSSDDLHRSTDCGGDEWDVDGIDRSLNALQTYHKPCIVGAPMRGWKVKNVNRAAFLYGDGAKVTIDGWTITDSNATFDTDETTSGVIRNCLSVRSGPITPGQGSWRSAAYMADGGGNRVAA